MGSFEGIDLSVARIQDSLSNNLETNRVARLPENAPEASVEPIVAIEVERDPLTQLDKAVGTHLDTLA